MGLKDKLVQARAKQKAAWEARQRVDAERASAPKQQQQQPQRKSRASREAEERAEALARELAELKARQNELIEQQSAAQRQRLVEARVEYAKRAGAKVAPDVLARILPDVDPTTQEGRQAIEAFRSENAALFAPAKTPPGEMGKGLLDRVERNSADKGRQPVSERKIFGADLVKKIVAKNLGGEA